MDWLRRSIENRYVGVPMNNLHHASVEPDGGIFVWSFWFIAAPTDSIEEDPWLEERLLQPVGAAH